MSTNILLTGEQIKTLLSGETPENYVLSSVYEIENVLLMIKSINNKINFFKDLKKFRSKSIDERIADLNERSSRLRSIILHTMKNLDPDHNTLNFPSIGSVTRRKPTIKWNIDDEVALKEFLEQAGCKDDVVKVKEVIDSRKLKNILDDFFDARVDVPCVTQVIGNESVSIKYEKTSTKQSNTASVINQTDEALESLDGLTVDDL